jgi:hypothetical protein
MKSCLILTRCRIFYHSKPFIRDGFFFPLSQILTSLPASTPPGGGEMRRNTQLRQLQGDLPRELLRYLDLHIQAQTDMNQYFSTVY